MAAEASSGFSKRTVANPRDLRVALFTGISTRITGPISLKKSLMSCHEDLQGMFPTYMSRPSSSGRTLNGAIFARLELPRRAPEGRSLFSSVVVRVFDPRSSLTKTLRSPIVDSLNASMALEAAADDENSTMP
jgi:hypothetical protein